MSLNTQLSIQNYQLSKSEWLASPTKLLIKNQIQSKSSKLHPKSSLRPRLDLSRRNSCSSLKKQECTRVKNVNRSIPSPHRLLKIPLSNRQEAAIYFTRLRERNVAEATNRNLLKLRNARRGRSWNENRAVQKTLCGGKFLVRRGWSHAGDQWDAGF